MSRIVTAVEPDPDNPPNWCFRPNENGELPTCSFVDGQWERTYEGGSGVGPGFGPGLDSGAGDGIPGAFVAFFLLAVVLGIAGTIWKVSTARRMATQSGMNPDDAAVMTMLTDDGFEATYLAANLRQPQPPAPASPAGPATGPAAPAAERLRELDRLLTEGLITQAERDERRRAIIDGI